MPNFEDITNMESAKLSGHGGTVSANSQYNQIFNPAAGPFGTESMTKVISLHIHYPETGSTNYNGNLTVAYDNDNNANTANPKIFACRLKPGETVQAINKDTPLYLSAGLPMRVFWDADSNANDLHYYLCVERFENVF